MLQVRPALPDDAEAFAALRGRVYPYLVRSPAAARHLLETHIPPWASSGRTSGYDTV